MSTKTYDQTVEQGADWTFSLLIEDADGDPRDLTDASARLVARTPNGLDVLIDISGSQASPGGEIAFGSPASSGTMSVSVPAATTADLDFDAAPYTMTVTFGDGAVERILEGTLTLSRQVAPDA